VLWSGTLLSPTTPWQAVLVVYTIMCVGFALLFGPLFTLSLGSIQPQYYSHGSAILGSIQQVAGAAGVALLIAVMSATQGSHLAAGAVPEEALSAGIRASFLIAAIISLFAVATVFFFRKPDPQPQGGWGGGH
jgi:MFS transporter, DHA2 family, lincomycin resistance protein